MSSPPAQSARKTGLLLVDDEPDTLAILHRILTPHYQVFTAAQGEEALRVLEREQASIRLVMADLTMPGLSGAALLRRLRALYPHLVLVAMSGLPPIAADGMLTGCRPDGYISKPVRPADLLKALNEHLV